MAWSLLPTSMIKTIARLTDAKGAHTFLGVPDGMLPSADNKVPLRKVVIPFSQFWWETAARAGGGATSAWRRPARRPGLSRRTCTGRTRGASGPSTRATTARLPRP